MKYLIDTNIISELTKPSPDVKAVEWIKNQDTDNFYISVMSIGEIEFGIKKLPESHRRSILERFFHDKLLNWFSGRIMIIDQEVMDVWSDIMALSEKTGKKLATADALIAVTARKNNLQLVSRNIKDFIHIVDCFNPFG